jgi:hypothetical protein
VNYEFRDMNLSQFHRYLLGISVSGNTDIQSGSDKLEQTSAVKCVSKVLFVVLELYLLKKKTSNVRVHFAQALRKQYVVRQIRQAHVLIIDEVSMMGPDLLEVSHMLESEADCFYS